MNEFRLLPDDPKLTAYALGELAGEELAQVEAALRTDPAARAAVEEIRALAGQLESALAGEPVPAVAAPSPAVDPYRPVKRAKVLRFPQVYYLVGGLAAAGFAVLLAWRTPTPTPTPEKMTKQYFEMALPPAPVASTEATPSPAHEPAADPATPEQPALASAPTMAEPTESLLENPAANAARAKQAEAERAETADLGLSRGLIEQSKRLAAAEGKQRQSLGAAPSPLTKAEFGGPPAPDHYSPPVGAATPRPAPTMTGTGTGAGDEVLVLSPFAVSAPQENGYGAQSTLAGTRLRTAASKRAEAQTESYAYRPESDFLRVQDHPLSTFSADVDTASYANVRRLLNAGRRPPVDAVRIEELLNYFSYAYAPPGNGAPFAASLEVAAAPWAAGHRLVRIGLKAREVATAERGAANLVFLLDVSGSMNEPAKLPLVKASLQRLLDRLRPDDRVAIVTYAGASGLALPSTPVADKAAILAALDALGAEGSTNGSMGIHLAYDIAKANFAEKGINRVILCTDGDFNVGVTSEGELTRLIQEKAKSGVFLTVLGFGMGNYKDSTMQQLADRGNGNYGYIDSEREAAKLLGQQLSGTLVTVAKDVKLQVEFNPAKVASYRLIGYEKRALNQEDFANDKIDAGEIGAGHTVTALYELVLRTADAAKAEEPELRYRSTNHPAVMWPERSVPVAVSNELLTVKIRYKEPAGLLSRKLEFPLTDGGATFAEASNDFKFAAAVAGFGMLLRDSVHKGAASFASVVQWAEAGVAGDAGGYRAEFIDLVKQAEALQ